MTSVTHQKMREMCENVEEIWRGEGLEYMLMLGDERLVRAILDDMLELTCPSVVCLREMGKLPLGLLPCGPRVGIKR